MEPEQFQRETKEQLEKLQRKVFGATKDENYGETPREHAEHHEEDNERHFLGVRNLDSAKQKIESFKNQYDEGAVKSLYGDQIQEYEKDLNLVNQLARIWSLPPIESLRK